MIKYPLRPIGLKWIAVLGGFIVAGMIFLPAKDASPERTITGTAIDDNGRLAGAVVRKTTENSAVTGSNGEFELSVPASVSGIVKLTAWAKGYYISGPVEG
jgi:hypothetical protein